MSAVPDLVCLGNFTIDDVVLPNGSEQPGCTGGDALYATLAARPWAPTAELVAPVGNDLPTGILKQIADAGLSDEGLPQRSLPTLRNRVEYFATGDRKWTLFATEAEFDLLSPLPSDIPAGFHNAKAFMILAMTLAAQERLVADLKARGRGLIALDPQEDYIRGNEVRLRRLIAAVDIFLPSAEEVRQLLGTEDWSAAARTFARQGPRVVVIKLGAEGCLVYDARSDRDFRMPAYPAEVIDTTGAGDSFCGAFMGAYTQKSLGLEYAAMAGVVAASFTVAGYGVEPLFKSTTKAMRERLDAWRAKS